MNRLLKSGKKTVELNQPARPSRIRREPVRETIVPGAGKIDWQSREWEIGLAIVGIVLFALALNALSLGVGLITN